MSPFDDIASIVPEITAIRRDIHAHPEIRYEEERTSKLVAEQLKAYGVDEIVTGLGKTGVVGVIRGKQNANRGIALRADMDALPIAEETGLAYASKTPGKMHACGHDGHTAMLLGAARALSSTRNFSGSVVLIFQPAEEGGAGAKAMMDDGLFQRFPIDAVYGMHNYPGMPVGQFALRAGPMMAASDFLEITIDGKGTHAARPHYGIDTVLVGSHIITALQSIVARRVDPLESAVVSICVFQAGDTNNVIPQSAKLTGTVRSFKPSVRDTLEEQIKKLSNGIAESFGARAKVDYQRNYPVLVNEAESTAFAARVAEQVAGAGKVNTSIAPVMGGEDFAFFLEEKPGAFIFAGNGDTASVHNPGYDFNDSLIPYGIAYWKELVEKALPLNS